MLEIFFGIPAVVFIIFVVFYALNYEKFECKHDSTKPSKYNIPKVILPFEPRQFSKPILSPAEKEEYQSSHHFNGGYHAYLGSKEWDVKRYIVLNRDRFKCTKCTSTISLQVHHKTYKNVYFEEENDFADLITLCKKCHSNIDHTDILTTWPTCN